MANRNIDERFRKPRRAKGTPFYRQRNYLALGICAFGGLSWYLFELWPQTRKLKNSQREGKFEDPPALKERILQMKLGNTERPELTPIFAKLRDRAEAREDEDFLTEEQSKPQPCSAKSEKLSKYFIRVTDSIQNQSKMLENSDNSKSSSSLDSPYKVTLKEFSPQMNDSASAEKDFATPQPINKVGKVTNFKRSSIIVTKKHKKPSRQRKHASTIQQTIKDNFQNLDVNPDHLQMALALSRSVVQAEHFEEDCNKDEVFTLYGHSPKKKLKSTLEEFGFYVNGERQQKLNTEDSRKRKKSKFAHITPVLFLRSEEDREALITSKVSLLLSRISTDPASEIEHKKDSTILCSEKLQNYYSCENPLFKLNMLDSEGLNDTSLFYTKTLQIPLAESCCGCLLKDWNTIPGRSLTPPHDTPLKISACISGIEDENKTENQKSADLPTIHIDPHDRSISPDLFSDEEYLPAPQQQIQDCETNKTPLSTDPAKRSSSKYSLHDFEDDNGICHFESFHEDVFAASEKVLTVSQKELMQLTDSKSTEEMYLKSLEKTNVEVCDLTVSSSEDECVLSTKKNKPGSEEKTDRKVNREASYVKSWNLDLHFSVEKQSCEVEVSKEAEDAFLDLLEEVTTTDDKSRVSSGNAKNSEVMQSDNYTIRKDTDRPLFVETNDCDLSLIAGNPKTKDVYKSEDECIKVGEGSSNNPIPSYNLVSSSEDEKEANINLEDNKMKNEPLIETNPVNDAVDNDCSTSNKSVINRFSVGFDFNSSSSKKLNITDYVNDILNQKSFEKNNSNIGEKDSHNFVEQIDIILPDSNNTLNEDNFNGCTQFSSQESNYVSDEELNYSSNVINCRNKSPKAKKKLNYNNTILEESDRDSDIEIVGEKSPVSNISKVKITTLKQDVLDDSLNNLLSELGTPNAKLTCRSVKAPPEQKQQRSLEKTDSILNNKNAATPKNNFIIKTDNVTPMIDYDGMDTPNIVKELDRYGLKPLKRPRGVKLLKYIYELTHPVVGPKDSSSSDVEEDIRITKKRKVNQTKSVDTADKQICTSSAGNISNIVNNIEIVGDLIPDGYDIDNLIFERRQSSKVRSCRIPLDIVWHNFVSSNKQIRENIMLFEPLQLEVLHMMLKEQGFKFHIQDLLTFLDRKCITVRLAQSQGNGRRRK